MHRKWMPTVLLILTLCGITAPGCNGPREGSAGPPHKITLALATIPETALVQIAQAKGYLLEEGLQVTVHRHQYGRPALQEVLEGKADFATVAETPFMFAIMEGKQVAIVTTIMTSSSSHAIVARGDRGIADFRDLRGKTIGITRGTSAEFFLYSILLTRGLAMQDVKVVDLKTEALPDALASGEIDAVATFLPYTALSSKVLGHNAVVFQDSNVYRDSFNVVSSTGFLQRHPETARRLLRALLRAERLVQMSPAEAQRIVAEWTGVPAEIIRANWSDTNMSITLDQTLLLSLEDESEWAIKNRLTSSSAMPNYLQYIHLDALRAVKPDAVRILR